MSAGANKTQSFKPIRKLAWEWVQRETTAMFYTSGKPQRTQCDITFLYDTREFKFKFNKIKREAEPA